MSKDEKPIEDIADTPLVAKLKKHKADNAGMDKTVLPETGITVTWPKFKPHGIWMKASRLAKGDGHKTINIYLPLLCKFDGEQLTVQEFNELVPTDDILHLTGEIMGDMGDEDEDPEGNVLH